MCLHSPELDAVLGFGYSTDTLKKKKTITTHKTAPVD